LPKEVDEPGSLSTVAQLERLGFEVKTAAVPKLGMVLEENRGPKVANLVDTLPAGNSGLAPGDEITRLDGFPYSFKALTWAIKHQKELTLSVTRGHRDLTFSVPVGEQQEISEVLWRGSAEQLARLQTWLGQPKLEMKTGEAISLKSHENFHSIQSVV
jgi:C-terminal processing protease CtpA/Prc